MLGRHRIRPYPSPGGPDPSARNGPRERRESQGRATGPQPRGALGPAPHEGACSSGSWPPCDVTCEDGVTGGEELCEVCVDCTSLSPSLGCHPGSHGRVFDNGITECVGGGVRDSGALGQDRSSRSGLTVPVSSPFSELLLPGGWEAKQGNVRSTKLRKPYDFVLPQVPTLPSEDAVGHSPTL